MLNFRYLVFCVFPLLFVCCGKLGGNLIELNQFKSSTNNQSNDGNGSNSGGQSPTSSGFLTQLGAITHALGGNNIGDEQCSAVTTDSSGNSYCAGITNSMGESSGGNSDAFVMKLNSQGTLLWVRQLGAVTKAPGGNNSGIDMCVGVTVDTSGNVYCAGLTDGSMGEANGGNYDAFVMKLNSEGILQWVTQLGTVTRAPGGNNSENDFCNGVTVDNNGNVYCAGSTEGSIGEASDGASDYDAFVMKLNSEGTLQWVRQLGAVTKASGGNNRGNEICKGVAVDNIGNVYCAGYTDGTMGEPNGGNSDAFVMKLNSQGTLQWVRQLGAVTKAPGGNNSGNENCKGVATDNIGNIYCAGYTNGSMGEVSGGNSDAFVMKLNSQGTLLWVRQLGAVTKAPGGNNSGTDMCMGVAVNTSGNVYCAGYTHGSMGESSGGNTDAFIMKLNSEGILEWVTQLGAITHVAGGNNSGDDVCMGATVDTSDNVYCAGYTGGPMGEASDGSDDAFVMRLTSQGNF
jgi:uncharacterized delta-60 repeat protein